MARSGLSGGLVKQAGVEGNTTATGGWRPRQSHTIPQISQGNQRYLMQSNQKQNETPFACIFINLNQQIHFPFLFAEHA